MSTIRLRHWQGHWFVDVLKGAEAVAEGAWVCIGGCPSLIPCLRLYAALLGQEKGGE